MQIISADAQWVQGEVGVFNFTVAARDIDRATIPFSDVSLYVDGVLYVSGIVLESPTLTIDNGIVAVRVTAYDELGRLTCYRAKADSHYQDQPITFIIADLLATTPDFVLGSILTLEDSGVKTTIDLRAKETLFAQIVEVVKAIPRVFLRYGGYNPSTMRHALDIGYFGIETFTAHQGENLVTIAAQGQAARIIRAVEAYGDFSASEKIGLYEASLLSDVTGDPAYPDYPIAADGTSWLVVNAGAAYGCEVTKTFPLTRTRNDKEPTALERNQAATALWRKAVRYLQENTAATLYTARVFAASAPTIADKAFIRASVIESAYDIATGLETPVQTFLISEPLRVTRVSTQFESGVISATETGESTPVIAYDLELTDSDYPVLLDDSVAVYEESVSTNLNTSVPNAGVLRSETVTVTHLGATPGDLCAAPDGKLFTFNTPTPPIGATGVYATVVTVSPTSASYTITQYATLATPMILCVQAGAGGWGTVDVTISVRFEFVKV